MQTRSPRRWWVDALSVPGYPLWSCIFNAGVSSPTVLRNLLCSPPRALMQKGTAFKGDKKKKNAKINLTASHFFKVTSFFIPVRRLNFLPQLMSTLKSQASAEHQSQRPNYQISNPQNPKLAWEKNKSSNTLKISQRTNNKTGVQKTTQLNEFGYLNECIEYVRFLNYIL